MNKVTVLPLFDSFNQTGNVTRGGIFSHKHKVRAIFRAFSFVGLIAIICVFNSFLNNNEDQDQHRRLQDGDNRKGIFQIVADPTWLLAPYVIGVLYMFLALAIVCDEYFVPALEVMSGELHLDLTADISGATLMAAGGSAPELFTSFIGTFQESEVGFGTIVGSAVFNVLFVIGMCSLLSKETLDLTWWPLFRDSVYYAVGLLVLAIFVGVITPSLITWWESFVLFLMYLGYIYIMSINEELYEFFRRDDSDKEETVTAIVGTDSFTNLTFRAGLITLIREPDSWVDKARVGFVAKILGNVDDVFDYVDSNGDGKISRDELKIGFEKIEGIDENTDTIIIDKRIDDIMTDINMSKDGTVSKASFKKWYLDSEEHINKQIKKIFDRYDDDNSGSIDENEFKTMLQEVEPDVQSGDVENAVKECFKAGKTQLTFDDFSKWYLQSAWYHKHDALVEEKEEKVPSICERLSPPEGAGCFGIIKFLFLLPLVALLALTVPDVRRPGMDKGYACYLAFILSICWIGVYSYFMVGWTEIIGETLGIDTFIMGMTFLAAGTSVPDLLSSVIVARMGKGDMAVSSSIGSNIFDILVGLPVPWLIYALWPTKPKAVTIGADGVWISIMILLGMLVLIISSIHLSGWRLTKALGYTMFFFYFCFLAQEITRYIMRS
jgi:K+-dependent Na+/Ca+ exchanger-like protein